MTELTLRHVRCALFLGGVDQRVVQFCLIIVPRFSVSRAHQQKSIIAFSIVATHIRKDLCCMLSSKKLRSSYNFENGSTTHSQIFLYPLGEGILQLNISIDSITLGSRYDVFLMPAMLPKKFKSIITCLAGLQVFYGVLSPQGLNWSVHHGMACLLRRYLF